MEVPGEQDYWDGRREYKINDKQWVRPFFLIFFFLYLQLATTYLGTFCILKYYKDIIFYLSLNQNAGV